MTTDVAERQVATTRLHLLEQAVADALAAGLVDRRVDDRALVLLTDKGHAVAEGKAA
jgi:hypothetical protein